MGELKIRIHPGRGREKPNAQMLGSVRGIFLLPREVVSERKRLHGRCQGTNSQGIIGGEFTGLRVHFAVLPQIRYAFGLGGIRPEIRRQAHVIMCIAAGRELLLFRHRGGGDQERFLRVLLEFFQGADEHRVTGGDGLLGFF